MNCREELVLIHSKQRLVTDYRYILPILWLQLALSSILFIEPAPYDVIGISLIGMCFLIGLKVPASIRTGFVLLGVFILANLVACLTVADPMITIKSLAIRLYMVISWFFFVCLIYENPKPVYETIWNGYIIAAVISTLVGALGFYEVIPYLEQFVEFGRVRAFFKDPNVYGPFLVPVALYAFCKLETARGIKMVFYSGLFLFISYGILLGFSRGSWINYILATILYTGFRFRTYQSALEINRLLKILGLVLLVLVGFIIYVTSTDKISEMLEIRFHVQHYDTMHGGRLSNQLLILNTALTHPLGVGAYLSEILFFRAPHNIYLHVLIESGWIGALAFYSFLVVTINKAYKFCLQPSSIQRSYAVTLVCTIGILVQSFFIDSTHWRHMYLLFAMLWGPALFWEDEVKGVHRYKDQGIVEP